MVDLSEDSDPIARAPTAESGEGGQEHQDRPKLVALPGPAAEPAPTADDAEPASSGAVAEPAPTADDAELAGAGTDADRLALERSLNGPHASRTGSAPTQAAAGATERARTSDPARTTDLVAYASVPAYAGWALQPPEVADAIALTATPELVQALRAELAMRAHAEASLRIRVVDAETRLAARVLLSRRTVETLRQVRAEFDQLASLLVDERARRRAAEQRVAELEQQLATDRGRSDDAAVEIAALRDSLLALRAPADRHDTATRDGESPAGDSPSDGSASGAPPSPAAEVRADRLSDALTRLRAGTEPIDPAPAGASALVALTAVTAPRATLAGPFQTLCRRDPALAGQLALSLLPMQLIADPEPVSYDIVLGPRHGCVQVTSHDGRTEVARHATARPLAQVDLHVVGSPERFAKLLAAGRIRRRLGFGLARVRGDRHRLAALDALLALPLDLPALVDGGMSTDPSILLSLVAAVVKPDWTRGARFSISHRDGNAPATYLLIADGRGPTVTTIAPSGPIATVISCAQSDLVSALTDAQELESASVQVVGDPAPLAQLQTWIKRAQSE